MVITNRGKDRALSFLGDERLKKKTKKLTHDEVWGSR